MEIFREYLSNIKNLEQRARTEDILNWVNEMFPDLGHRVAWNQPMFIDHGTFIISFSVSKNYISISPERACINHFAEEITQAGYEYGKETIKIKWNSLIDFSLLKRMIEFNISDKSDCFTFWRK